MSDIVKRLRERVRITFGGTGFLQAGLMDKAADEIERLSELVNLSSGARALNDVLDEKVRHWRAVAEERQAEIEQLKKENARLSDAQHLARLLMQYDGETAPVTTEAFQAYLKERHRGDCTSEPFTCTRCWAEDGLKEAEWLIAALREEPTDDHS